MPSGESRERAGSAPDIRRSASGNRIRSAAREPEPERVAELIRSHGLPQELATAVAREAMTLNSALAVAGVRRKASRPGRARGPRRRTIAMAAVLGALLGAAILFGSWRSDVQRADELRAKAHRPDASDEAAPNERVVPSQAATSEATATVRQAADDRTLVVEGPMPEIVAAAYCEARPACASWSLTVEPDRLASPGRRIIRFADAGDPSRIHRIALHRSRATGCWSVQQRITEETVEQGMRLADR